ncbi:MAG TPA: NERD domain-containing protein, partial [Aggregatilineales bacterium]|nr:NERD domain-containing protein [Aggregatilineales bacterium]
GVILNRVAWCDIHFFKAGFITKRAHATDSQLDEFSITPMGFKELKHYASDITVGYLQSFYKGKVIRGAKADDSTSEAERTLYQAFSQLGDEWTVIQGVSWFAKDKDKGTVGEIDFLIAHRKHGVLVLEVKGGVISAQNGNWTTTNRNGETNLLKPNPFEQAERNRRELKKWLKNSITTKSFQYAIFPAIAFPDSQVKGDIRPDCPEEITLDIRHVENVEARLLSIFAYWSSRADKSNERWDGQKAIDGLVAMFQVTKTLQPQISEIFKRENKIITELTQSQFKVLNQLRRINQVAIMGCAGTGKTLLAMEKAQQLLIEGYRVLILCYNRNLQSWLQLQMNHEALMVFTFHQIVGQARAWAGMGENQMTMKEFDAQAPDLLMDVCDILHQTKPEMLFDAIIVDEAQDFHDTWWVAISELLKDPKGGISYVFFDDNQRIYTKDSRIPAGYTPLSLSENYRNTQYIHAKMMEYAHEGDDTECFGPEGRPIEIRNSGDAQKDLQRVLHELINEQGISANDIIILTPASQERSQWKENLRLGNFALTWVIDNTILTQVRVSTIYRYKGLESAVVILTELDKAKEDAHDMLIYVGMSRARNHVVVIGELPTPKGQTQ